MSTDMKTDVIVVGGGIAGASAAYFLSSRCSVVIVERETAFGYHSTGRSAAIFTVAISAATMRRMAQASRRFFIGPPSGFAPHAIVSPRGSLTVAWKGDGDAAASMRRSLSKAEAKWIEVDAREAIRLSPSLRADNLTGGTYEPGAMDIDVDLLLQGFIRGARANGARILTSSELVAIERRGGAWNVIAGENRIVAPILVNAAGAWADQVAELAGIPKLGVIPCRRTAFTFEAPCSVDVSAWPHTTSSDPRWYIKPDAGRVMGSLGDQTPTTPSDVQPEELDIAQGIYNIEQSTTLNVSRPVRTWAGLRSFVSDREPVSGFDPVEPGFYWLCGQAGCGVLTSPAMGEATAAIVLGQQLPAEQRALGIDISNLSPSRLARPSA